MDLFVADHLAGLHVVVQTQGVAHLVQYQVVERLLDHFVFFYLNSGHGLQHLRTKQVVVVQLVAQAAEVRIAGQGAGFSFFQPQSGGAEDLAVLQAVGHKHILQHYIGAQDLAGAWVGKAGAVATKGRHG
ncbi:hypothetical protein ADICEAN_02681 [Cesiribacter andamanensis AMV16]|uniref:Uncharacterized protein n=1 Tax=Cesiribacter andamanensis AMV16 TaxID=1279009 RepID=M7N4E8_9BACT|nr:hypothetical protein ADICEAN_02681 [Cesiribacter andamanensis AMV16]